MESGRMAQQLTVLESTALEVDSSLVLSVHILWLTSFASVSLEGVRPPFGLLGHTIHVYKPS